MDTELILEKITQWLLQLYKTSTPYLIADYQGEPFQIFDTNHLAALGSILFIILLLVLSRKKMMNKNKENIRDTIAAILIVNEIAWHLWAYFYDTWTLQKMLPLHVCSILVWLSALMLINKSYRIYEFAYFLGIGGALQSVLTPDAGIYGFPHFRFFQTFISHGLIIIAAIYMTVIEKMRPTWKSIIRVFAFSNIYMVIVFGINTYLGSNYLYVNHKPPTASILDLLPEWPIYILYIEGIGIVTMLLLYLPFFINDWIENRKLKEAGTERIDDILQ